MGADEVRQFLTHLAVEGRVSASTQSVALCALLLLYLDVLRVGLSYFEGIERAKRPARLPVVFTRAEVAALLSNLSVTYRLVAGLLYGPGLRLLEALRLRVKDLDFEYMAILVRDGKGGKDRRTGLPRPLTEPLRHQFGRVRLRHEQNLRGGRGEVYLPDALDRKYPATAGGGRGSTSSLP